MEEFSDLLDKKTQKLILASLYKATVGDSYRFGHLDSSQDNLYPAYSNPVSHCPQKASWELRSLTNNSLSCELLYLAGQADASKIQT